MRDFGGENGGVEFELDGVGLLFATPRERITVSFGDRARRGGFRRVSWLVLDALTVDTVHRLLTRRRQSRRPWFLHAFVYAFVLFLSSEPLSFQLLPDRFHRTIIDHQNPRSFARLSALQTPAAREKTFARQSHLARSHERLSTLDLLHGIRIRDLDVERISNRVFDLER